MYERTIRVLQKLGIDLIELAYNEYSMFFGVNITLVHVVSNIDVKRNAEYLCDVGSSERQISLGPVLFTNTALMRKLHNCTSSSRRRRN